MQGDKLEITYIKGSIDYEQNIQCRQGFLNAWEAKNDRFWCELEDFSEG